MHKSMNVVGVGIGFCMTLGGQGKGNPRSTEMIDDPRHTEGKQHCRAFIRRVRPQGYTVVCQNPVAVETWAYGPNGERVYHIGRCLKHPDKSRYSTSEAGWRVVFVPIK